MDLLQVAGSSRIASAPIWKRLGIAGFLFFLTKGLLWLLIPAAIYLFS